MLLNPSVPRGSSLGDDFSVPRSVCAVEAMRHPWAAVWVMISQFLGLFAMSKPCVTRGRSFVDDF